MTSYELRKKFLTFFQTKEHLILPSSPLIPKNDQSVLFTPAGMLPFKSYFEYPHKAPSANIASCQKCLRTNDLTQVGKTNFHHTFFEMLGNFSFNNYFKKEALRFAWEFSINILNLNPNYILVSVYGSDNETADLWHKDIGLPKERIIFQNDNFWGPVGISGSCGPCTELYFDTKQRDLKSWSKSLDDKNIVEYWNIVFNQYYQDEDQRQTHLKFKGVDTGMGLERVTMLAQNKQSVYETDLFQPICQYIMKTFNLSNTLNHEEINAIADHMRATLFIVSEHLEPSNEGRGYVIRRLLRRSMGFIYRILKQNNQQYEPMLWKLLPVLVQTMQDAYPEIKNNLKKSTELIKKEEVSFLKTLSEGYKYLSKVIKKIKQNQTSNLISGKECFILKDSMGFPIDLIQDIAFQHNLSLDIQEFQILMNQQIQNSKKARKNRDEDS